jgi:hypothetical protein
MKLSRFAVLPWAVLLAACAGQGQSAAKHAVPSPNFQSDAGSVILAVPQGVGTDSDEARVDELQRQVRALVDRVEQRGCPVMLTSAGLTPHFMLVRREAEDGDAGGLDLEFHNASGKAIRVLELSVHVLVRRSVYDLGATSAYFPMTASGTKSADKTVSELRHLAFPQGVHPARVADIALRQVVFEDGTVWSPASGNSCGYSPDGALQIAAK